jgi:hypothetical protein
LHANKVQLALDRGNDKKVLLSDGVKALRKLDFADKVEVLVVFVHVEDLDAALEVREHEKQTSELCEQLRLVLLDALESVHRF